MKNDELHPIQLGRMQLSSGNIVRLIIVSDGLKLVVHENSLRNGDIIVWDDEELGVSGFGVMPEKGKE
jgi:hypothetical protein